MSDRTDKSIERQERKTRRQFEGVTFVLTLAETMQLYAKPILVHQIASQRSAIGHSSEHVSRIQWQHALHHCTDFSEISLFFHLFLVCL